MGFEKDSVSENNEIVGYQNGKYIVRNDYGDLFFFEAPQGIVEIGEVVPSDDITPIGTLPEMEQEKIIKEFE